jgi:hypothetical protein
MFVSLTIVAYRPNIEIEQSFSYSFLLLFSVLAYLHEFLLFLLAQGESEP